MKLLLLALIGAAALLGAEPSKPVAVAWSPDGQSLAIADAARPAIVIADAAGTLVKIHALPSPPEQLIWVASGIIATLPDADAIAVLGMPNGSSLRIISTPALPRGIASCQSLPAGEGLVAVVCQAAESIALIDPVAGRVTRVLPVGHQPAAIAVGDGLLVVADLMPDGAASASIYAMLLDGTGKRSFSLPPGSTAVRALTIQNGRAVVVHTVAHHGLPITHSDRAWIHHSAVTAIDLRDGTLCTWPLDRPDRGEADPWGIATDAHAWWITISGGHDLIRLDHRRLPPAGTDHLGLLSRQQAIQIIPVAAGPRGIALSTDGRCAVAHAFAGKVTIYGPSGELKTTIITGDSGTNDRTRHGEALFHDARLGHQGWLSCASCHIDGRIDGVSWDLLLDGIGNPKDTRTLVGSAARRPLLSLGGRADATAAIAGALRSDHFHEGTADEINAIQAFLTTLRPHPLASDSAVRTRGQAIFAVRGCQTCHVGGSGSDGRTYDVGTTTGMDAGKLILTPALVELWRTAPYLHDGSAPTLAKVLDPAGPSSVHRVPVEQHPDLIAYLRSM